MQLRWFTLGLVVLLGLFAGCDQVGQNNPNNPNSPTFTISLNPTSLTVTQGGSGKTRLTVTPGNGFSGTVSLALEGAPQGVTFSPKSVVVGSGPVSQDLTIEVASGTPAGTYNLTLKATSGNLQRTASLTLKVDSGPSFTISLDPTSLTVTQGGSVVTRLTVTPQNNFSGTLTLSLDNPPQGLTLTPQSVTVSSRTVTQELTLATTTNTPVGQYTLTLRAVSGNIQKTATLTLTVNQATTFTVNTASDTIDADPGNGQCADANGNCSLRAAVMEANALKSPTIINIPAGTYTLNRESTVDEQGYDLDLIAPITLRGQGATPADTVITTTNAIVLVEVHPGQTVRIENLTLSGARPGSWWGVSAGLYNGGAVTVENVVIRDGQGYGFYNKGGATATLVNVNIQNNGDVGLLNSSGGDVRLTSGTIQGNGSDGVLNYGTATLTEVVIQNNGGDGVHNLENATLIEVTVRNNGGAGLYQEGGTTTVLRSTLSGNRNRGIYDDWWGSTLTLINTTVSGNSTGDRYGGGGVYISGGTLNILFSTITGNTAPRGGGLRIEGGTVKLKGVILANNTATSGTGPECEGSLQSLGYNLVKSNADCAFTRDATDILNQDPLLGPLQDNGGSVPTHMPSAGSPVLDKVPTSACTDLDGNAIGEDARGVRRPQGSACDIGAVERN